MKLSEFITCCENAINANYALRNRKTVIGGRRRMLMMKKQRDDTIRRFIAQLRAARDPRRSPEVARAVAYAVR